MREQNVSKNLNDRYEQGRAVREGINLSSRLTGGNMFKVSKIVLDEEVSAIREGKENEKLDAKENVIRNVIIKFKTRRYEYQI